MTDFRGGCEACLCFDYLTTLLQVEGLCSVVCVTRVIMNSNKVMILKEVVVAALILAPYVGFHNRGRGFAHVNEESAGIVP